MALPLCGGFLGIVVSGGNDFRAILDLRSRRCLRRRVVKSPRLSASGQRATHAEDGNDQPE
ncbi:MAG: hypothetical protein L3J88_12375 [Gammaproteobacteria bacterium]|nr:hypothetical protein [Gammaproteobacteria bacterium]MCF6364109.1 hypothetical protein [Gammaproteobacteria bacterium]